MAHIVAVDVVLSVLSLAVALYMLQYMLAHLEQ
jgi:hypothetical protein